MKIKFLLLLFFCFLMIYSQEKNLKGKIFIDDSEDFIEGIYIKNRNKDYITITDLTGFFSIFAKIGDTISFEGYNILPRNLVVNSQMFLENQISVHLNIKEEYLSNVTVYSNTSYGSIDIDVRRIPYRDLSSEISKNIGILDMGKKYDGRKNDQKLGLSLLNLDVQSIFDIISGAQRKRERLYAYEDQLSGIQNVKKYFGEKYFIEQLGVEKDDINNFIFYNYLNNNLNYYFNNNDYYSIDRTFRLYKEKYFIRKNSNVKK